MLLIWWIDEIGRMGPSEVDLGRGRKRLKKSAVVAWLAECVARAGVHHIEMCEGNHRRDGRRRVLIGATHRAAGRNTPSEPYSGRHDALKRA